MSEALPEWDDLPALSVRHNALLHRNAELLREADQLRLLECQTMAYVRMRLGRIFEEAWELEVEIAEERGHSYPPDRGRSAALDWEV